MKTEAQRIAIAEACGWTNLFWLSGELHGGSGGLNAAAIPDYLNDLNAMHEAEKVLTEDDADVGSHWRFIQELIEVAGAESMECHREVFVVAHATAAQRAESFLRSLNLWIEDGKGEPVT